MLINGYDFDNITTEEYLLFYESICNNPYILYKPYPKQSWPIFEANRLVKRRDNNGKLLHNHVLAGAGGFGGKTYLGTMLAAQYLTEPNYSCLVTRKNYTELIGIDSIFQNLINWTCDSNNLGEMTCKKTESKLIKIKSPTGAEIHFKAFDHENKKQKIKSESYDRIINDEASELDPRILSFQHRSLRQSKDSKIPLSIINLSNPGGPSTEYLINNFINPDSNYPYIAIDWRDNPYINKEDYETSLDELDIIDKQYQKYGNWHYKPSCGDLFDLETLQNMIITEFDLENNLYNIMSVDFASTGNDKTAITCTSQLKNNTKILLDLDEESSPYPENMIYNFLEKWNPLDEDLFTDKLIIEQEPGSDFEYSKRYWMSELEDFIVKGLKIRLYKPTKSKYQRARPLSRHIQNNKFFFHRKIIENHSLSKTSKNHLFDKLFNELIQLDPEGNKKSPNLVDSLTQANNYLDKKFNNSKKRIRIIA